MYTGLDWIDFEWTGVDWIGLDWTGLDWTGLNLTGLEWTGLLPFGALWLVGAVSYSSSGQLTLSLSMRRQILKKVQGWGLAFVQGCVTAKSFVSARYLHANNCLGPFDFNFLYFPFFVLFPFTSRLLSLYFPSSFCLLFIYIHRTFCLVSMCVGLNVPLLSLYLSLLALYLPCTLT